MSSFNAGLVVHVPEGDKQRIEATSATVERVAEPG